MEIGFIKEDIRLFPAMTILQHNIFKKVQEQIENRFLAGNANEGFEVESLIFPAAHPKSMCRWFV